MVYYPVPLHRQPMFTALGYAEGSLPEAERAASEVLSLPIYPELTGQQVEHVARALREALQET
jgi:dTDP-4-amino-4,6-dideoxygalactose transaminase